MGSGLTSPSGSAQGLLGGEEGLELTETLSMSFDFNFASMEGRRKIHASIPMGT